MSDRDAIIYRSCSIGLPAGVGAQGWSSHYSAPGRFAPFRRPDGRILEEFIRQEKRRYLDALIALGPWLDSWLRIH